QLERVRAELVADNYFALLGVQPRLGRAFLPEENRQPRTHPVAILSFSLWQSRFGGDARVLGHTVTLNQTRYAIVGVAPAGFRGVSLESPTDVWVPAMTLTQVKQMEKGDEWFADREWSLWRVLGRLKPGVSKDAAQAALDTLALQVRDAWMPEGDRHLPFNERHIQLAPAGKGLSS